MFQNWLRDTTLPLRISIKLIPIKASYLKRCFSKSNKHVVQLNVRFATLHKSLCRICLRCYETQFKTYDYIATIYRCLNNFIIG